MPSVIIIGGARRIGAAMARTFAQRGYDVGITYRTSEREAADTLGVCHSHGVRAAKQQCDVSDAAALASAFSALVDAHGVPDVLIVNAGIFPGPTSIDDLDVDAIRHAIDVNTLPLVTLAKAYREKLTASGGTGRLISMSSLGAVEIWRDRLAYNVSKSALVTAVRSLARSAAPQLSVNTVAPGAILISEEPNGHERAMTATERIPMGRYGTSDDVMDAVWFFATCSPYITGQFIAVDGGYHLHR